MVRTKARAKRLSVYSDPCSSNSDPDLVFKPATSSDIFWGTMVKDTSTSTSAVVRLDVRDPSPGNVLSTPDGLWVETEYYFVKKDPSLDPRFYYRDLSFGYERRRERCLSESYDKVKADRAFSGMIVGKAPYPLKEKFAGLSEPDMDRVIRATFHLGPEIEWRWPEPGERIYDRRDGFVGFWLEHLRSGWNPRSHQFVKHLFKYVCNAPKSGVRDLVVTRKSLLTIHLFNNINPSVIIE